jgi:hypothetical protein
MKKSEVTRTSETMRHVFWRVPFGESAWNALARWHLREMKKARAEGARLAFLSRIKVSASAQTGAAQEVFVAIEKPKRRDGAERRGVMETITLPKSGITMKNGIAWLSEGPEVFDGEVTWTADLFQGQLQLMISTAHNGAIIDVMCGQRWSEGITTLDEAISWLDARVLELRSALLPADSVVVNLRDAEERVTLVIVSELKRRSRECKCEECPCTPCIAWEHDCARAVLAALAEVPRD